MELGLLLSLHRDWYSCFCSPNKSLPPRDLLFQILSFVILQFNAVWSEQLSVSINYVHHNNPTSACAFDPLINASSKASSIADQTNRPNYLDKELKRWCTRNRLHGVITHSTTICNVRASECTATVKDSRNCCTEAI
jgi:hypothetical protein